MNYASASGPGLQLIDTDLVRIARARVARGLGGQSLGATALVHEVWLKLSAGGALGPADRRHYLRPAAQAMR